MSQKILELSEDLVSNSSVMQLAFHKVEHLKIHASEDNDDILPLSLGRNNSI